MKSREGLEAGVFVGLEALAAVGEGSAISDSGQGVAASDVEEDPEEQELVGLRTARVGIGVGAAVSVAGCSG